MDRDKRTHPGQYLRRDWTGRLQDAEAGTPDAVICRRVADYPFGRAPSTAGVTPCVQCGAPVAFNPAGPHQDRPRVCMQCAGIQPLPYGD